MGKGQEDLPALGSHPRAPPLEPGGGGVLVVGATALQLPVFQGDMRPPLSAEGGLASLPRELWVPGEGRMGAWLQLAKLPKWCMAGQPHRSGRWQRRSRKRRRRVEGKPGQLCSAGTESALSPAGHAACAAWRGSVCNYSLFGLLGQNMHRHGLMIKGQGKAAILIPDQDSSTLQCVCVGAGVCVQAPYAHVCICL